MADVRKMGQGMRRRLGAPSNHLAMATPDAPQEQEKQKTPAVKPRAGSAANMRASVRDQW